MSNAKANSNKKIFIIEDILEHPLFKVVFTGRKAIRPSIMVLSMIDQSFGDYQKSKLQELFNNDDKENDFRVRYSIILNDPKKRKKIEDFIEENYKSLEEGINQICHLKTNLFSVFKDKDPILVENVEKYSWVQRLAELEIYAFVGGGTSQLTITKKISVFPKVTANFIASNIYKLSYRSIESALGSLTESDKGPLVIKEKVKIGNKSYTVYSLTNFGRQICTEISNSKTLYGRLYNLESEIDDNIIDLEILLKELKNNHSAYKSNLLIKKAYRTHEYLLPKFDKQINEHLPDDSKYKKSLITPFFNKTKNESFISQITADLGKINKRRAKKIVEIIPNRNKIAQTNKLSEIFQTIIQTTLVQVNLILDEFTLQQNEINSTKFEQINDNLSNFEKNITKLTVMYNEWFNFSEMEALGHIVKETEFDRDIKNNEKLKKQILNNLINHEKIRIDLEYSFKLLSEYLEGIEN